MRILYLDDALDDLVWFHHYYAYVFSEGAKNALRQFDTTEELLTANPFIGQVIDGKVRKLHISNTPFAYIYQIKSEIQILRVWDERRDPNEMNY